MGAKVMVMETVKERKNLKSKSETQVVCACGNGSFHTASALHHDLQTSHLRKAVLLNHMLSASLPTHIINVHLCLACHISDEVLFELMRLALTIYSRASLVTPSHIGVKWLGLASTLHLNASISIAIIVHSAAVQVYSRLMRMRQYEGLISILFAKLTATSVLNHFMISGHCRSSLLRTPRHLHARFWAR